MIDIKFKHLGSVTLCFIIVFISLSAVEKKQDSPYLLLYEQHLQTLHISQDELIHTIEQSELSDSNAVKAILGQLQQVRLLFKPLDFWLRYTVPIEQKRMNGPLPVEWETEVFEKFEKPYKRLGGGYTLAFEELHADNPNKTQLLALLLASKQATEIIGHDSILQQINSPDQFYLCNRLFLLNLAAIYTTGFDCPDESMVIPELNHMMVAVASIYKTFNLSYPEKALSQAYLKLYEHSLTFLKSQPTTLHQFDHYTFIRDYVNPLFALNQELIKQHQVKSKSLVDYTISKQVNSIFDKKLYFGQNPKGIFIRVTDETTLNAISELGKLLFYDPIVSGNVERSCASCHIPQMYFTDTTRTVALNFDRKSNLSRNTPSLLNVQFNHLLMMDGKHLTLQAQAKGVITSKDEMGANEEELVKRVLSCKEYNKRFKNLLAFTPQEKTITSDHIVSAITFYYSKFSQHTAPFDRAMNHETELSKDAINGFNLFMGKAQCATCHFVPQFNGVKPPYIGSEFEVIGVPEDTLYTALSLDSGRYTVFQANETLHAFRTGTIRNSMHTQPYMHNGVFNTMEQVLAHYNTGGAVGHGIALSNQTLSSDSLHLTPVEIKQLIRFMESLTEDIIFEDPPIALPVSKYSTYNKRSVSGNY